MFNFILSKIITTFTLYCQSLLHKKKTKNTGPNSTVIQNELDYRIEIRKDNAIFYKLQQNHRQ